MWLYVLIDIVDDGGRYAYNRQPEICRWNCLKLAEMLQKLVPMEFLTAHLDEFDKHFEACYIRTMRNKVSRRKIKQIFVILCFYG